jgi:hypothetical protein
VTRLARLRDRAALPELRAGNGVERARVPVPPIAPGGEFAPAITTWPRSNGTQLYGVTMSTSPSLPNVVTGAPLCASTAISRRPAAKMMRGR